MGKPSLVSICVSGFAGTDQALRSLADGVDQLRHYTLSHQMIGGPETLLLIDYINQLKPQVVIFGSWSKYYEPFLAGIKARVEFGVYWTSSSGQTEIASETEMFVDVLSNRKIKHIFFSDESLAASNLAHLKSTYYLPPCYFLIEGNKPQIIKEKQSENILSFFCSPHEVRRKNALNTILALAGLERKFTLYLNGLTGHKHYKQLLKKLGVSYREFGWMSRSAYEQRVNEVSVGLQVSFAESFNQVVAEHIVRGIPVVASAMIPVLKNIDRECRRRLIVNNPEDSAEIADKVRFLLDNSKVRFRLGHKLRRLFITENAERIRQAKAVLTEIA